MERVFIIASRILPKIMIVKPPLRSLSYYSFRQNPERYFLDGFEGFLQDAFYYILFFTAEILQDEFFSWYSCP